MENFYGTCNTNYRGILICYVYYIDIVNLLYQITLTLCVFLPASHCMCDVSTTSYEAIQVDKSSWTQSISTETAESIVHCGIKCSNRKKTDNLCHGLRFEDGVCELTDSWIQSNTSKPYITVFRQPIGKSKLYQIQS